MAKDLSCRWDDGILVEEGSNQLVAWGCGKRATYALLTMSRISPTYVLDSVVPDDRPEQDVDAVSAPAVAGSSQERV